MNGFKVMVITLSTLTVIGVVALVLVLNFNGESEASGERSIDDIREASFSTEEITTDLQNGDYVRISFRVVTDSKESMEELKKRDFQMQNILLKELSAMDSETFQSGLSDLEAKVKLKLNEFMSEGEVTDVYTVNKVLQ
ncbi:flagellar basal body-associated protein FliL [Halobacillus litoralis]|uniref:flagellar basal body-associated protein FliL n=1 Tax=Halobacillus litoralis TaxID=45668 RepID=UPI001CFC5E89|nr:flagellar basal body-associated protein FliL [Halobacillus litoralis]WLR46941.1 flagellar basal body-associated protein FliL [Halobacillus litoralis]